MTALAAICLNEEEFIEAWLSYHYESFDQIILCEGAARNYPHEAVTVDGLSTDRTAEIIYDFPDPDNKIEFIQHGWAGPWHSHSTAVPAKIELRNVYAERLSSGYIYTLDIDEFLHPDYIARVNELMDGFEEVSACALPSLHLWQDTAHFITGGYANYSHYRAYRWKEGSRYEYSHNWPSGPDGVLLIDGGIELRLLVDEGCLAAPAMVHYGFCESKSSMAEKNDYYILRGENETRPEISQFRDAALRGVVPEGCTLYEYYGFLPFVKEVGPEVPAGENDFTTARPENFHPHNEEASMRMYSRQEAFLANEGHSGRDT